MSSWVATRGCCIDGCVDAGKGIMPGVTMGCVGSTASGIQSLGVMLVRTVTENTNKDDEGTYF